MTQRIDGTDALEGYRVRFVPFGVSWLPGYERADKTGVTVLKGARPRMILCRDGRLPVPPAWAKSARLWYKTAGEFGEYDTGWWNISNYFAGTPVSNVLGVEFSGKDQS